MSLFWFPFKNQAYTVRLKFEIECLFKFLFKYLLKYLSNFFKAQILSIAPLYTIRQYRLRTSYQNFLIRSTFYLYARIIKLYIYLYIYLFIQILALIRPQKSKLEVSRIRAGQFRIGLHKLLVGTKLSEITTYQKKLLDFQILHSNV